MNLTAKRTVAVGALVTGLILGGTGIAMAANEPAPGATGTAADATAGSGSAGDEAPGTADDHQDPTFTGSVPAPRGAEDGTEAADDSAGGAEDGGAEDGGAEDGGAEDGDASEAEETTALEALATTTPRQATDAATAAVPGTAGSVELDDENGYVVYDVEVTTADGTTVEVMVDAGNTDVLAQEADDD